VNTPREKGGLGPMNIPLLADKNHSVSRAYGVLKEDDGISFRGLFIIDGKSVLRQVRRGFFQFCEFGNVFDSL
jgi:alkyl hydroperoxide reductase subunit AhpC